MLGLRDDPAGWDAYEERLRFILATEDRPATDAELFGLVRKEKAGRKVDGTGLPEVAGKSRELLRNEELVRWEDAFKGELYLAGHTETELASLPHAQGWKVSLARQMRDRHGASANWLAIRMSVNSGAYLRKLLAQGQGVRPYPEADVTKYAHLWRI